MSWAQELIRVYDENIGREFEHCDNALIPISHMTVKAHVEISIDAKGNFLGASVIQKPKKNDKNKNEEQHDDTVTIIPATEASAGRSNDVSPHPFADKLVYIAGDYATRVDERKRKFFDSYIKQLVKWKESDYCHRAVTALFNYVIKETLIDDLVKSGILILGEDGVHLAKKVKINGVAQESIMPRFIIHYKDCVSKTWLDKTLHECFVDYYDHVNDRPVGIDYLTGETGFVTYKHPKNIRQGGDAAKLFSAADSDGLTYRGIFEDKSQAISIGYNSSQKLHNALKWLLKNFEVPIRYKTSKSSSIPRKTILWTPVAKDINQHILVERVNDFYDEYENPYEIPEDMLPGTMSDFQELLTKYLYGSLKIEKDENGNMKKPDLRESVCIMSIDGMTTGRLAICDYAELPLSTLLENVQRWHEELAIKRPLLYNSPVKHRGVMSPSISEILAVAFGTDRGSVLKYDDDAVKGYKSALLSCVMYGKKIPKSIVRSAYEKACHPESYPSREYYEWALGVTCALIQKEIIDTFGLKGDIFMNEETKAGFDPIQTDRSYLFGCLYALADAIERYTFGPGQRYKRETNAARLMATFRNRPASTWNNLAAKLTHYLPKVPVGLRSRYEELLESIMNKFSADAFTDEMLNKNFILGCYHFKSVIYKKAEEAKAEENNTDENNENEVNKEDQNNG